MTAEELTAKLRRLAEQTPREVEYTLAEKMEIAGLRFVDDNFINQSWEGHPWAPTKRGNTILVKTGNLKSGFRSSRSTGEVRIFNRVKYAKAHNEGFSGKVNVREHTRAKFEGPRTKRKRKGNRTIEAHSRQMNLPRRQFTPTPDSPSPTLQRQIRDMTREHLLNLIKTT
jgi:hypothetical protein